MALADYQKLTWVLPGLPFGDGTDGVYTSTSYPGATIKPCSGTASSTTLSLGSSGYANGDILAINQTRGTGVAQWQFNQIVSGGGTTTLTLKKPLSFTFTDGGNNQAQAVKIHRYSSMSVASGTWTLQNWNESVGGLFAFACKGNADLACTINANGGNGTYTISDGEPSAAAGRGFVAGKGRKFGGSQQAQTGEGSVGARLYKYQRNGSGGGGANPDGGGRGGGGGGAGKSGGGNGGNNSEGNTAQGGLTAINAELTSMTIGGGGGGGACDSVTATNPGSGGGGAGMVYMMTKNLNFTGILRGYGGTGGGNPAEAARPSGGGGGGGSIMIQGQNINIGTTKMNLSGGSGLPGSGSSGGNGGTGAVAIHYSSTTAGTTTPSGAISTTQDGSLLEGSGAFIFNLV